MNEDKKPVNKFICICCDYKCSRKYDYDQHLSTQKHKQACNRTISDNLGTNEDKKPVNVVKFSIFVMTP